MCPEEVALTPDQEQVLLKLSQEIRCPTCQGQSLHESFSPTSQEMVCWIRQSLHQGYTPETIKETLTHQFGDQILLSPPMDWETSLLWGLPLLALGILMGILGYKWCIGSCKK